MVCYIKINSLTSTDDSLWSSYSGLEEDGYSNNYLANYMN